MKTNSCCIKNEIAGGRALSPLFAVHGIRRPFSSSPWFLRGVSFSLLIVDLEIVRRALSEDVGSGDVTTLATVPPDQLTLKEEEKTQQPEGEQAKQD